MDNKIVTPRFIFIAATILVAALSRLLPHPDNFSPIAAMALFGGTYFTNKKLALIIPIAAMLISDLALSLIPGNGFHNVMPYVYGSFMLTTLLGFYLKRNIRIHTVLLASLTSSVLFFLITNFGVWTSGGMKGGMSHLLEVYNLGIPFFRNTFAGDLCYNTILFGSFYLACLKFPKLAEA